MAASALKGSSPENQTAGAVASPASALLARAGGCSVRGRHGDGRRRSWGADARYWFDRIEELATLHYAEAGDGADPLSHLAAVVFGIGSRQKTGNTIRYFALL